MWGRKSRYWRSDTETTAFSVFSAAEETDPLLKDLRKYEQKLQKKESTPPPPPVPEVEEKEITAPPPFLSLSSRIRSAIAQADALLSA